MLLYKLATLSLMASLVSAHFMSQVHFTGNPHEVQVLKVARPNITSPTDAIVRITRSAICGSDLHNYRGFFVPEGPVGHEAVGIVHEIGSAVTAVSVGDHVIIPSSATNGYWQQTPQFEDWFYGLQGQSMAVAIARIPINTNFQYRRIRSCSSGRYQPDPYAHDERDNDPRIGARLPFDWRRLADLLAKYRSIWL